MTEPPASLLLQQFDILLITPDAVDQLDRAILELAVRGRLVKQDPTDEPAQVLLSRIENSKTSDSKQQVPSLPAIDDDEIPYPLPSTWAWARLGNVTNYGTSTRSKNLQLTGETWVLDLEDIEKDTSRLLSERLKSHA